MAKYYLSRYVYCPHYKGEKPQMVRCDGVVSDSVLHHAFADRSSGAKYKRDFCRGNYKACAIYRMLEEIDFE
jgi:hypothetical protein